MMLACAQITIRDENDIHVGAQPPARPALDQLWLDSSVVPNLLHRWNGASWEQVGQDFDTSDYYTIEETDTLFSQTKAEIALKAASSTVTALSTRVASAEQKITPTALVSTVRASTQYQYDLNHARNYVTNSHNVHMFVDNFYRYASGSTTSFTSWQMPTTDDLFAHSGSGANLRISFDIKRTGIVPATSGAYTGVWIYYRYINTDGVTVSTTGRGWLLRNTDPDFVATDSDWVRISKGPLNLTTYAPISIAYFLYGTTSAAGTKGTVQFRNVKVEVGNGFTSWSAAPEDLATLPGRVSTAESRITQNSANISLRVSQSIYDSEKIYRSTSAPASPTANMLWLNTSVSPYMLSRWTGSTWVAVGTDKVVASGINITPNDITLRTTNFILQL